MSLQFKLGIVFGLIVLVGAGMFVAKIAFKLAIAFMAVGVAFVGYQIIKGMFFKGR